MSDYPNAPMGMPPSAPSSSNGTLILVLGILSIVLCQILGPVAWIMGNNALRTNPDPSQLGMINGGRICGIIGTVLLVLYLVWVLFFGGMAILGGLSGHHAVPGPTTSPAPGQ